MIRSEAGAFLHGNEYQQTFSQQTATEPPPKHFYQSVQPEPNRQPDSDYYAMLELPYGATFKQIKAQYRKLLSKYHPDKFAHDPIKQKDAEVITRHLNAAYEYFEKRNRD